jgi:hypothetical protein
MSADSFQHPGNLALQVKYIRTEPLLFLRSLFSNPPTAFSNSCSGDEQILTQSKIKIAPVSRFFTHVGIEGKENQCFDSGSLVSTALDQYVRNENRGKG